MVCISLVAIRGTIFCLVSFKDCFATTAVAIQINARSKRKFLRGQSTIFDIMTNQYLLLKNKWKRTKFPLFSPPILLDSVIRYHLIFIQILTERRFGVQDYQG